MKTNIKNYSKKNLFLHPSNKPNVAKTKNGDALPTYSYINPPNGGPTIINNRIINHHTSKLTYLIHQVLIHLRAVPIAFPRSSSSGYRSANIPRPI